jgi:hypothetical protein
MTDLELVRLLREAGRRWRELQAQKEQSAAGRDCDSDTETSQQAADGVRPLDQAQEEM